MGWSALILLLIELFGPLLIEWLRKWLEDRLNRTAERLPSAESYANKAVAATALFDEAIRGLPWFAFGRKALLRRMRATAITQDQAGDPVLATKLDPEDTEELRGLAMIAENE